MSRGGKRKQRRPGKDPDVLGHARKCLASGDYLDTRHGAERKEEREITLLEIQEVIRALWDWREAVLAGCLVLSCGLVLPVTIVGWIIFA